MKAFDERVRSKENASDAGKTALLLYDFARDHYHLLLVGQFKIKEIGRGIQAAIEGQNETVLLNLARAFIEHTAAIAYQLGALEKAVRELPKKPEPKNLWAEVERHHQIVKKLHYNQNAAVHVNDMIGTLTKHDELARQGYEDLCEFVHPNYGSNKLVSSGQLGAGQIRSHSERLAPDLAKAHRLIEMCAILADDKFKKSATFYLSTLASWIEVAGKEGAKLSQIFSMREASSGDGKTKETAIVLTKARTRHEAIEALYAYLRAQKIKMLSRQTAAVEGGYLYDKVETDKGPLWVKCKMTA
ncbi:hypothetical protein GHK51_14915 [Sinorhizobium meliloti]|uniref:hypothetical protein n=1 Tax=Rhizobium meliloti TaxID=382 RepID=UPI0012975BDD|nr:hypothetical protein [Sinorhizobium meliloti]MQW11598.1 hypothetical protein [Sinorhizobium meliloti]